MLKRKLYRPPAQHPVSGLIITLKDVKSFGLGNAVSATVPPSNSVMSALHESCIFLN